jgi:hypothetical protein
MILGLGGLRGLPGLKLLFFLCLMVIVIRLVSPRGNVIGDSADG